MKDKPKSRRTVKEWEMEIERVRQNGLIYAITLHDVVVTDNGRKPHPNRSRVGSSITVHVKAGEDRGAEDRSVTATMYRPEGGCPSVMLHWKRVTDPYPYYDYSELVEVTTEDEFLRVDSDNERFLPLLRDRMRRAVAEYHRVKKEVVR